MLALLFGVVFGAGTAMQDALDRYLVQTAAHLVEGISVLPAWLRSFLADGVISGAGLVATFAPLLLLFFLGFGVLEGHHTWLVPRTSPIG